MWPLFKMDYRTVTNDWNIANLAETDCDNTEEVQEAQEEILTSLAT